MTDNPFAAELAARKAVVPAPAPVDPVAAKIAARRAELAGAPKASAERGKDVLAATNPFAAELASRKAAPANPFAAELAARQSAPADPAAPKTWADTAKDAAASFGSGVSLGSSELLQLPVTALRGIKNGLNYGADKIEDAARSVVGAPLSDQARADRESTRQSHDLVGQAQDAARGALTSALHKPETKTGEYAASVGAALPGVALMPARSAAETALNAVRFGVPSGLGSEAGGQMAKGSKYEPAARAAGGAIGALAGPVLAESASRIVSPIDTPASRLPAIDVMRREGVPLTAGQATGSKPLKWMESAISDLPFAGGGANRITEAQREAFTQAGLRRMGVAPVEGQLATPETMRQGAQALRDEFNDLSSRNVMVNDAQLRSDLRGARTAYDQAAIPAQQRPVVGNTIGDLLAEPWGVHGERYQNTRSSLSKQAEGLRFANPPSADALRAVRDAMDAAMRRSISPQDARAWDDARQRYGDMKTLEKAMGGAGEQTAQGVLSPMKLRAAASAGNAKAGYVRGNSDLGELARAGETVLAPLPQSGTAPRQAVMHSLQSGGAVGAALSGHPIAAAAGVIGPAVAGRALMSPVVQAYLRNRVASGVRGIPTAPQLAAGVANGAVANSALTPSGLSSLSDLFAPQRKAYAR
ncbi:hypothetical protein Msil_3109 [Methylocella silvestris BL2]|uniref:Uncharacterized protein n=1 Tax=Methylocella silvestris (strain DSM 15510 / CIP 108128 / LMG 27833 / NCIMB 13906 / BL2) TaxID=395965 RepID=B8EKZ0_METSB|nr:hypothetical protein [Methylocella silvestris]ACK52018.1 hypothetical protein Msil_3109 [Methylocella silvestris BL2]